MRVMLAKLLLEKPSLLMLDEPTNHLDLPSIQWVEKYVQNYEGSVIVVSHDREFVDNVVDTIVEVSGAKLNYYAGDYSYYMEEKACGTKFRRALLKTSRLKFGRQSGLSNDLRPKPRRRNRRRAGLNNSNGWNLSMM